MDPVALIGQFPEPAAGALQPIASAGGFHVFEPGPVALEQRPVDGVSVGIEMIAQHSHMCGAAAKTVYQQHSLAVGTLQMEWSRQGIPVRHVESSALLSGGR